MIYPEHGDFTVTIKLQGSYRNDYPHLYPMGIVEDAAEQAIDRFESCFLIRQLTTKKFVVFNEARRMPRFDGAIA
jgi:hypothetical protein